MVKDSNIIKILSLDPGINHLGWSIIHYDKDINICEVQKTGEFKANKVASKRKDDVEVYGQSLIALDEIEKYTMELVETYAPDFVACEDTFYNPRRPTAHASLLMCISTIKRTLYHLYKTLNKSKLTASKLYLYAPRLVKSTASKNGSSLKNDMLDALMNNNNITFKSKNGLKDISDVSCDHQVDAICVGYTFVQIELLSKPFLK